MDEVVQRLFLKLEELKEVHTPEDLERVTREVKVLEDEARRKSPYYQLILLRRKAEADRRAEAVRLKFLPQVLEVKDRASRARTRSEALRSEHDAMMRGVRMLTHMEDIPVAHKREAVSGGIVCPKCGNTNASNIILSKGKKGIPYCFKCQQPMVVQGEPYARNVSKGEVMEDVLKKLRGVPD